MDFELTEEQRMFQNMARKFAEQEILPPLKENERQERFDSSIIQKLAAQGLLAPHLPQEYGGLGLDYVTAVIIWESLCMQGRVDHVRSTPAPSGMLGLQDNRGPE